MSGVRAGVFGSAEAAGSCGQEPSQGSALRQLSTLWHGKWQRFQRQLLVLGRKKCNVPGIKEVPVPIIGQTKYGTSGISRGKLKISTAGKSSVARVEDFFSRFEVKTDLGAQRLGEDQHIPNHSRVRNYELVGLADCGSHAYNIICK